MCACATVPHLGSNVMETMENLVVKLMPDSILIEFLIFCHWPVLRYLLNTYRNETKDG